MTDLNAINTIILEYAKICTTINTCKNTQNKNCAIFIRIIQIVITKTLFGRNKKDMLLHTNPSSDYDDCSYSLLIAY